MASGRIIDLIPLLHEARAEPIGLLIRVIGGDVATAKRQLYQARAKAQDPALAVLQIRTSPWPDGDLVICKGAPVDNVSARATLKGEKPE